MKPYKGLIRIACNAKRCPDNITENVEARCVACPVATLAVVDLEGKVVAENSPVKKKAESSKLKAENKKGSSKLKAES